MLSLSPALRTTRRKLRQWLRAPHLLAILPALVLGAYWAGGETGLLVLSFGLPALFALAGGFSSLRSSTTSEPLITLVERGLEQAQRLDLRLGLFILNLDDFDTLDNLHGAAATRRICRQIASRLVSVLRQGDTVARYSDGQFVVVTSSVPHLDLENAVQLARRLQDAVEEPIVLDGVNLYLTCSIGFCLDRQLSPVDSGLMIDAAQSAVDQARANGPSAIRAYAPGLSAASIQRSDLAQKVVNALDSGAIQPWFQPQMSTDTGRITGFEALARWQQGSAMVPPTDFLPVIEENGLQEQLGEVMLSRSLLAMSEWDRAGFCVPRVGVNFSAEELRNPKLLDRLNWNLDRYDLQPERLVVEVLESVVAVSPEDMVVRNIHQLGELGCTIDLDDFGTGHASIAALRRFAVNRIKIDRSFICNVDKDPDQQRMVTAILSMAEQLGLDSLAEGVESPGEHALLAQLGCGHVQGFGIARPMPFDRTAEWIRLAEARAGQPPQIGRKTG